MSIQMASNKKEVDSVSTRVKNTKKEIEQLKAELEKLIHSGSHLNKSSQNLEGAKSKTATEPPAKTATEPPGKQPEEAPQPHPSTKRNAAITQKKPEPPKDSPTKKTRSYNVAEAREYIKKQKEKRAEQLKTQINVTDNRLDLKKQKLKELHQKTLELVNKNVQLKRERSKSRNREEPLRPDKANLRQKSLDRVNKVPEKNKITLRNKSQERCKKENVSKPSSNPSLKPQARQKSQSRERPGPSTSNLRPKSQERPKSKSRERAGPSSSNSRPKSQERITKINSETAKSGPSSSNSRPKNNDESPKPGPSRQNEERPVSNRVSRSRVRKTGEARKAPPLAPIGVQEVNTNLLYPPNFNLVATTDDREINLEKTMLPPFENGDATDQLNRRITIRQRDLSEHSIMTDACRKDSKETQTSRGNQLEEPSWLRPSPALPYPYNFINTVKRKLQHAINSPRSCVDVGVQNSDNPTPEVKSKEEIKEMLVKSAASELKSFASHRCLDLQAVENLELVPNHASKKSNFDNVSKNIFVDYDSESDTSKNIPEISSESLISSRNNKDRPSNSEPKLSLDRLKDLKLQPHTIASPVLSSDVKTDTNGYPKWRNESYSSDFLKESEVTSKSGSTIRTMTSERKQTDIPLPSISSVSTNRDSGRNSTNPSLITTERSGSTDGTDKTGALKSNSSIKVIENFVIQGRRSDEEPTFKSLLTEGQISKSTISSANRVDGLKEPTVSLSYKKEDSNLDLAKSRMKNITIRPTVSTNNNINEIHLKFEAEVRLLNDFNESLRQFMNVEKAFENLKHKNDTSMKVFQNVDTQTSVVTKSSTAEESSSNRRPSINYSRGSDIVEELSESVASTDLSKSVRGSTFSTELNLSNVNGSISNVSMENDDTFRYSVSNVENYNVKNCAGLSLNMFEQLIKDEDARIQHLKAIIKIREQALLDRTKGELVWLEIQKKQLIETGRIEEASLLKKKQRGIILKHEQERNEIKKLKQMQKEASEERKNILKRQRNLIKSQLSTKNMLSKIKVKTPKERRSSFGPLRVVQSCSESIHSETSISRKSSVGEDVLSVTSHSVRLLSEFESEIEFDSQAKMPVSNAKRQLSMREAALQKRRKAAEELLRWHRKLLDEEKKIAELEAAATSVIRRMPSPAADSGRYRFNGKQLNQLWKNMTGRDDRKFVDDKTYVMSQLALERLCRSARQSGGSRSSRKQQAKAARETTSSDHNNYSSLFEPDSVQEIISSQDEKSKISSSISELIDNFSRIEDEISLLSRRSEQDMKRDEDEAVDEDLEESKSSSRSSVLEASVLKMSAANHVAESVGSGLDVAEEISDAKEETEKTVPEESGDVRSSTSPKENTDVVSTESKIEEIEPVSEVEEEIVIEKSPEAGSEKEDERRESSTATEIEHIEEQAVTEKSSEEHIVTEESKHDDDDVVGEKIEQEIATVEESPEVQVATETSKAEDVSVVEYEDIELNVEAAEESETKNEATIASSTVIKSAVEGDYIVVEEEEEALPTDKSSEEETSDDQKRTSVIESEQIETVESTAPSVDVVKESLALDEALECASKIEESLIKLNKQLVDDQKKDEEARIEEEIDQKSTESKEEVSEDIQTEDISTTKDVHSLQEQTSRSEASSKSEIKSSSKSSDLFEKTPPKKSSGQIDVKKRVSEILADANAPRGDKSPRLQDLYVTAYDVGSTNSSEFIEPLEDGRQMPTDIFGSEAEELWRKQLAIEQEIKQLEQQQKEQLPYVFMREIPNKPPPPYTPPSSQQSSLSQSVLPMDVKQINEISGYSSKVLHKAYLNNNLDKVKFSENGFKLFSKVEVTKACAEFVFNICKDMAREHYRQFEKVEEPTWLTLAKKPQLAKTRPLDAAGLDRLMNNKLKELFGFKKAQVTESAIVKWGKKKRDHVDEILVIESQEEESQWTNFDMDELIVKDVVTADIMKMLIDETASVFGKILAKKKIVVG